MSLHVFGSFKTGFVNIDRKVLVVSFSIPKCTLTSPKCSSAFPSPPQVSSSLPSLLTQFRDNATVPSLFGIYPNFFSSAESPSVSLSLAPSPHPSSHSPCSPTFFSAIRIIHPLVRPSSLPFPPFLLGGGETPTHTTILLLSLRPSGGFHLLLIEWLLVDVPLTNRSGHILLINTARKQNSNYLWP